MAVQILLWFQRNYNYITNNKLNKESLSTIYYFSSRKKIDFLVELIYSNKITNNLKKRLESNAIREIYTITNKISWNKIRWSKWSSNFEKDHLDPVQDLNNHFPNISFK